ncbi:MAG: 6-pyruvoyl-tetrahydropterin synthase-related protein, partial [Chromatiaceae bacterium]|nr:6-pyruvoyl-tetrahydropterin synthase-related protein [Candidatus Thioaporhodococcus sediminis]
IPSQHDLPGDYYLLVEVAFRDRNDAPLNAVVALGYSVAGPQGTGEAPENAGEVPAASLEADRILWQLPDTGVAQTRLTLTTEPAWALPSPLTPSTSRIVLLETGEQQALANWTYPQLARLDWVQNDRHFSRVSDWKLPTDAQGRWQYDVPQGPTVQWLNQRHWLWILAGLLAVGAIVRAHYASTTNRRPWLRPSGEEWMGGVALIALTAWTLSHAVPSLWLTHTWSTGGDVASQVFYAKVFMEWLPTGKISGWLPESFAGFPAFTYYFPLPFTLMGLLQFAVGQQVAFKLVSMLPAFLLPAATYVLCWIWGWRVPLRLLAVAGAVGFILGDATSIWGGNVLAQLAGEFAYSWGFLFVLLFWGALSVALQRGGRWWLLAALVEALVALSHGYALLVGGFGAFLDLLFSRDVWRHLRIILQVHLLAFLLIGFWLIPLLENLPWTIPNDSATAIDNWQILWPTSLWLLALGWIPLLLLLARRSGGLPYGIGFLMGIFLLGLLGFVGGGRFGLADLRFFPYAQWALAVASGAALGWGLQRWGRDAALPLAIAMLLALGGWWAPRLDRIEGWSRWNLSGYEVKPLWPHFLAAARTNAASLAGPRLVFEHDPANNDLGSTRTLEALPMFGSRPTLEGLYMESALTGPFIYQLQAEISQRPSSPLSRFPSSARSIDDAVEHLNELYVNRLLLRSSEKKALFGADARFRLVAEHGPLQTYELKELKTQFVEVLDTPIVATDREGWLRHAFRRFLLDHPYRERQVFLAKGESLPTPQAGLGSGRVEILDFSRERLVFKTDRPGQPHLIRMTYHPRWSSTGGEAVYLTEPSFMLVYP